MLELLWPTVCVGCERMHRGRLCPACHPGGLLTLEQEVPGIRAGWALAPYHDPLGRAVQVAKYRPDRGLMRHLGRLLAARLVEVVEPHDIDVVVPVPSPALRRARRGFASGAVLAREVAGRLRLPVRHALHLTGGYRQAALSGAARRANLRGRLRSRRPAPGRVLLVDDVLTTGATVDACCRELLGDESEGVWLALLCVAGERPVAAAKPSASPEPSGARPAATPVQIL